MSLGMTVSPVTFADKNPRPLPVGDNLQFAGLLHFINKVLCNKKPPSVRMGVFVLAEQEGFEPSVPFWGTHDFQSCPL